MPRLKNNWTIRMQHTYSKFVSQIAALPVKKHWNPGGSWLGRPICRSIIGCRKIAADKLQPHFSKLAFAPVMPKTSDKSLHSIRGANLRHRLRGSRSVKEKRESCNSRGVV